MVVLIHFKAIFILANCLWLRWTLKFNFKIIKCFLQVVWISILQRLGWYSWVVKCYAGQILVKQVDSFLRVLKGMIISVQLLEHKGEAKVDCWKSNFLVRCDNLLQLSIASDDVRIVVGIRTGPAAETEV